MRSDYVQLELATVHAIQYSPNHDKRVRGGAFVDTTGQNQQQRARSQHNRRMGHTEMNDQKQESTKMTTTTARGMPVVFVFLRF
jgi:hypothetical protein